MNEQFLLERGVEQWNQWRAEHPNHRPDLRGLDLSRAYLYDIDLTHSILIGVNLSRACLIGADLTGADLGGANLRGAYLSAANLSRANLSYADLAEAQVNDANLQGANLSGTCLASKIQAVPLPSLSSQRLSYQPSQRPSQGCDNYFNIGHTQLLQPTTVFDAPQFSKQVSRLFDTNRSMPTAWWPAICR